jgi:undecaprenyl-diphosphatase
VSLDFSVYERLNDYAAHHDRFEDFLRFFSVDGQVVFIALLAVLFFARGKYRSRNGRHGVAAAGFSALLALAVAQVIGHLWDRMRPYEAHLMLPLSHDPSFPSDHAIAAFAIAIAICLRHRRAGLLALVLASLVSVSRVALGTHYPSDVLGGAILGALCALVFWIPPVRQRLHRLADWAGELYERLIPARLSLR